MRLPVCGVREEALAGHCGVGGLEGGDRGLSTGGVVVVDPFVTQQHSQVM